MCDSWLGPPLYTDSGWHCFHRASSNQVQSAPRLYYQARTCHTHHSDVEGVQQVKGQGSHQVHKEPGGGVVDADVARLVNHLPWLAHKGGAEIQDDVYKYKKKKTWNQQQEVSEASSLIHVTNICTIY